MEDLSPLEFERLKTNGIKVNYYCMCRRKAWLFSKGLRQEFSSDRVRLGRLLHRSSYSYLPRKEVLIEELIKVDVVELDRKVLEVKLSSKMKEASRVQLAYYLLFLKRLGGVDLVGELCFPKERRREEVRLDEELEAKVLEVLRGIKALESSKEAPEAERGALCRVCSYEDLCWG